MNKNIIVITGAANGICNQIARDLDKKSNVLCLFDTDERIEKLSNRIKKAEIVICNGDVTSLDIVKKFIDDIVDKYGKIDVLINGAAVVPYNLLSEEEYDHFMEVVHINLGGYMMFIKEVSYIMKKKNKGIIVNISSISSMVGIKGQAAYASSKGAILALTRVASVELGEYGIRVNGIAPGSILVTRNETKMLNKWNEEKIKKCIPLGRLGKPDDVSGVVRFLLSNDSKYITGTTIIVDGGMTITGA